jgi:cation diffusion facilitator family transporter
VTPQRALWLSVAAAAATIALKWGAWWATGSVAFLSDALDSLVNLAAAGFALWAVSYARRPADAAHPYGYGKAEYFSSALEGALIVSAAAGIVTVAAERFFAPQPLHSPGIGSALSAGAAAMNFAVARILIRTGKAQRSLATEADGHHLMADVWMTAGVIAGVGAAWLTGWLWLDPAVALLIAVNLLREGWRLVGFSFRGLMDAAWPADDIRRAQAALTRLASEGSAFHNLRTRRSGARRFALVELHVPADWNVARADALARSAESAAAEHGVALMVRVVPAGARRAG